MFAGLACTEPKGLPKPTPTDAPSPTPTLAPPTPTITPIYSPPDVIGAWLKHNEAEIVDSFIEAISEPDWPLLLPPPDPLTVPDYNEAFNVYKAANKQYVVSQVRDNFRVDHERPGGEDWRNKLYVTFSAKVYRSPGTRSGLIVQKRYLVTATHDGVKWRVVEETEVFGFNRM